MYHAEVARSDLHLFWFCVCACVHACVNAYVSVYYE